MAPLSGPAPTAHQHAPLIVTAALDKTAFAFFDTQRRRHFPPARNQLTAHLTLFHALPPSQAADIIARLKLLTRGEPPIPAEATGLINLGGGVAYRIHAPALDRLREALVDAWLPLLSAQDRSGFRPHITIQNKAKPAEAKALVAALTATFTPIRFTITGLDLWHYLGGPWAAAASCRFQP
jgi:2'-5' RNA ligase